MNDDKPILVEHRLLLALISLKLLLFLWVGSRYGIHRDELYYVMGGRHLDLGYVDHPFVVPMLAGLAERLFGVSAMGLRLFSTLASCAVLYLCGVMTALLGGGRRAQLLAGLAILVGPFHLMTQNMFQTVPVDQLTWAVACLVLVLLLRSGDGRIWLAFGVVAGIGLLTKYTFLALGAATVVGLILTSERRHLMRPWIYLGGVVALLIFLPNLLWQVEHGWPTLQFMANNSARNRTSPPEFLLMQWLFMGVMALPLFLGGFVFFFSKNQRQFRLLGVMAAFVLLSFLVLQSKPYYTTAIFPLLFAGGAVWMEQAGWLGRLSVDGRAAGSFWKRNWAYLLLLGNLLMVPVFLPVLPIETYARFHDDFPHPELGEMIGWPELVETIGSAYRELPPEVRQKTVVLTSNYGSAADLDLFGDEYDLPPALCFQNSYYYWSLPESIESVLAVGFSRETVEIYFGRVVELGVVSNRYGVDNEEAGKSFFLATEPKLEPRELREALRRFS